VLVRSLYSLGGPRGKPAVPRYNRPGPWTRPEWAVAQCDVHRQL